MTGDRGGIEFCQIMTDDSRGGRGVLANHDRWQRGQKNFGALARRKFFAAIVCCNKVWEKKSRNFALRTLGPVKGIWAPVIITHLLVHKERNVFCPRWPSYDLGNICAFCFKDWPQKWPQMAQNLHKKGVFLNTFFRWLDEGHKYHLDASIFDML